MDDDDDELTFTLRAQSAHLCPGCHANHYYMILETKANKMERWGRRCTDLHFELEVLVFALATQHVAGDADLHRVPEALGGRAQGDRHQPLTEGTSRDGGDEGKEREGKSRERGKEREKVERGKRWKDDER